MKPPKCPYCDRPAALAQGKLVYPLRPHLYHRHYYLCTPCNAYVGCHEKTLQPFGTLANAELRAARRAAHEAFDPLWKSREVSRTEAYAYLAKAMGVSNANCHIGMFTVEQCEQVREVVSALSDFEHHGGGATPD